MEENFTSFKKRPVRSSIDKLLQLSQLTYSYSFKNLFSLTRLIPAYYSYTHLYNYLLFSKFSVQNSCTIIPWKKRKRERGGNLVLSVTDTRANTQQRVKGVVSATETHNGWRAHAARPCNYQRARVWVTRVHACTDVEERARIARTPPTRLVFPLFFVVPWIRNKFAARRTLAYRSLGGSNVSWLRI